MFIIFQIDTCWVFPAPVPKTDYSQMAQTASFCHPERIEPTFTPHSIKNNALLAKNKKPTRSAPTYVGPCAVALLQRPNHGYVRYIILQVHISHRHKAKVLIKTQ
jgi:hypothetical protein